MPDPLSKGTTSELDRYRDALTMIANMPTTERNPDGDEQAAWSMQLVAQEALANEG